MLKFENVDSFHPFHPKTVISHLKALFQARLHLFKVILKSTLSDLGLRALNQLPELAEQTSSAYCKSPVWPDNSDFLVSTLD